MYLSQTMASKTILILTLMLLSLLSATMATDAVAQLADSLAKTGVEDGELSYKGQGRKLDDSLSGTIPHF